MQDQNYIKCSILLKQWQYYMKTITNNCQSGQIICMGIISLHVLRLVSHTSQRIALWWHLKIVEMDG